MIVEVSTHLDAPVDQVWEHVTRPALLTYVTAPLVTFRSLEPSVFPERWIEGPHEVEMRAFGFLPLGRQTIGIDMTQHQPHVRLLRDRGSGQLARVWDHVISLEAEGACTRYQDHVVIKAGVLTPFVWGFAQLFYRWRQHRWRQLVRSGFNY